MHQELEYKLLFAVVVAGKSAKFAQAAMQRLFHVMLLELGGLPDGWFAGIRDALVAGRLGEFVRAAKVGNYTKTARAFQEIVDAELDLEKCTVEELEAIHGIGQKTSRFFLRWSGRRERIAVLDVHILRWLAEQGCPNVPQSTPQSIGQYSRLEDHFLKLADGMGIHPADLDEKLWLERNRSGIRS